MPVGVTEAREILEEWVDSEALRIHMRSVELVMRALAEARGADPDLWGKTGLLHDADYDRWPDEHPRRIVDLLRERGEDEMADAIAAHYTPWGVPAESELARALLACDELTGFILAVARVRPNLLEDLTPRSVKKKLKDRSFAKGVERDEVYAGLERLGVELDDHIRFIIETLRPHVRELFPDRQWDE